uniref:Uncharacterized protein n=1 Tax=Dulem virus 40 TaxID=3145758 RepID=A0AAU8AVM0_9CAUD
MADYPKFSFDKNRLPYWPLELTKEFEEYAKRQSRCLFPYYDDFAPSMSFEKFKELLSKNRNVMVVDEPTQIRQRIKISLNPTRESPWLKAFEEWLKEKENGAE